MTFSYRFVVVLATASFLLQGANANLCTIRPNVTDSNYYDAETIIVSSMEDVMTALDGCSAIDGSLVISNDYNGPLDLCVEIFNGTIYQPASAGAANLTAVFLPCTTYIQAIELVNVPALQFMLIQNVTQMSDLILMGNSSTQIFCESLVTADVIYIDVEAITVNFSQLVQVNQTLDINAGIGGNSQLDFPSLINATSVSLIGNMSSFTMPNLANALMEDQKTGLFQNVGFQVVALATAPLVVDLPLLSNATGINLQGNLQNISFPSLLTLDGLLDIVSETTIDVELTALQNVMAISVAGNISSFSMPAIKDVQAFVVIDSLLPLDCSVPEKQFAKTNNNFVAGEESLDSAHYISCKSSAKKRLSTGAKVGIAFGVIAFFAAFLFVVFIFARKWRSKKGGKRDAQPAAPIFDHELDLRVPTHHQLDQRPLANLERPPPYAESVHSDIGPLAEPKSGV